MGSVSGVVQLQSLQDSIYSDVFHWVQHSSSSSFHTFVRSGHEKVENWHWTLWYPIPLYSCISVSNSSRTLLSRCISRSCKELSCLLNTWLSGAAITDEDREIERRLATAAATIAVWLFFKWKSPKFSNNFLKTGIIQMKFLLKGYLKVSGYETLKNKDQVPINPLPFQKLRKFNPHCCCVFWHPNALVDMAWAQTVCVSRGDEGTWILWRSRSTIDWSCCHLNNSWSFSQAAMSSTCWGP